MLPESLIIQISILLVFLEEVVLWESVNVQQSRYIFTHSMWTTNAILIKWIKYPFVHKVVIAADMRSLGQLSAMRILEPLHAWY